MGGGGVCPYIYIYMNRPLYINIYMYIHSLDCCLADVMDVKNIHQFGSLAEGSGGAFNVHKSDPKGEHGLSYHYIPLLRGNSTAAMPSPDDLKKTYYGWGDWQHGGTYRFVMHGTSIENLWDILCYGKVCRSMPRTRHRPPIFMTDSELTRATGDRPRWLASVSAPGPRLHKPHKPCSAYTQKLQEPKATIRPHTLK